MPGLFFLIHFIYLSASILLIGGYAFYNSNLMDRRTILEDSLFQRSVLNHVLNNSVN